MTLEQLRALVMVGETGSILAASEALHKTQPTVSVSLKKLEEELGLQLISRDRYRAALTPAGEAFCRRARALLEQSQALRGLARHLAEGNEPEIRIAIEAGCPLPLVLKILSTLERKFPGTQFNLSGETLWGALERLELGEADLAISPVLKEDLAFEVQGLGKSTLCAVAAPEFRTRFAAEQLELSDLKGAVQVVVRDSSRKRQPQSFGFFPEGRHWYVTDHQTKKEILLAGMGWGRMHEHLVREELESGALVPLSIRNYPSRVDVDICIARKPDTPVGPVAQALWEAFAQPAD